MNAGKPIRELEEVASVAAGSSYIVESGDGAGTKRITHENLVKAVGDDLPLGIMEDLQTDDKNNLVGAVNEVLKKTGETFKGADEIRPGNKGAVPAPQVEDRENFLRGDGTWAPVQGTGSGVDAETLEGHNAEYFQAAEDQELDTSDKTVVGAINELQEKAKDTLKSKEELMANTDEGKLADSLLTKELYKNLGGVSFGITADGQPGYKKAGADTVIPFTDGFGPFQWKSMYPTRTQDRVATNINMSVYETGIIGKELRKTLFYIPTQIGIAGNSGSLCSPGLDGTGAGGVVGNYIDTYDPDTGTLKLYGFYNRCGSVTLLWM